MFSPDVLKVQELCGLVPWTMSPGTDLIAQIRHSLGCNPAKAARMYEQAIEAGAIRSIEKVEWQSLPPGTMTSGGLSVPTGLTKWELVPESEVCLG